MHIHYLAPSTIPSDTANSVHVMKMCQAFAWAGHEVTLNVLRGEGGEEAAFDYYGVEPCFSLVRHVPDGDPTVARLLALGKFAPGLGASSAAAIVYARRAIRPLVDKSKPGCVYARHMLWLTGLSPDVPFVAESHEPPANRFYRQLERRLFRRPGFRRLVVISTSLRDIYASLFPMIAPKITVLHDAADDPLPTKWPRQTEGAGFNVGYVGHLYPGRGTELIQAIAQALPDFTFHLVGGTEADRSRVAGAALPSNIIVHGHQPHSRLTNYFPLFDAVLAPYQRSVAVAGGKGDTSSFMSPLKLFEYMSWGKPIVCSDLPVLREIIEHGRNGILLPADDVGAWVAALRGLNENLTERARLGGNARADFFARHTWRERACRALEGFAA